jgi:hypothetical protein
MPERPGLTEARPSPPDASARQTWLDRAAWAVIACSILQILLFGFGRDQSIYAVVADSVLGGGMPYRDAWDFKPPGIFVVFALAQALFGKTMVAVRLVEGAGLVATVFAFRRLGRTLFDSQTAGLLGAALAVLLHAELEFWHTAQPESFGGMLTVFALVAVTGPGVSASSSRTRLAASAGAGLLFGLAFLMKPPLGGGALVCAAYLARAERWRAPRWGMPALQVLAMGLSSLCPIALVVFWFWVRGALPALRWTLFEFTPGYTALGWQGTPHGLFLYATEELLVNFSYLLPAGIALAVFLPRVADREREALLLVSGIASVHLAGIALQAKFFQYHYGATLPLVSLVGGLGLYKGFRWALRLGAPGVATYAALVGLLAFSRVALRHNPGTFWERSAQRMAFLFVRKTTREELDAELYRVADFDLGLDRRAARDVARLSDPRDPVYVWGFEPALYFFAERRPASRFIYDVPQRVEWQRTRARDGLLADLHENPPRVIVVQHGDVFPFVTGDNLDSAWALPTFPELHALIEKEYRYVESVEDLDLFQRR